MEIAQAHFHPHRPPHRNHPLDSHKWHFVQMTQKTIIAHVIEFTAIAGAAGWYSFSFGSKAVPEIRNEIAKLYTHCRRMEALKGKLPKLF